MKDNFLTILCKNHQFPIENLIGWTTELQKPIHCWLCKRVIYDPDNTGGNINSQEFYFNLNQQI